MRGRILKGVALQRGRGRRPATPGGPLQRLPLASCGGGHDYCYGVGWRLEAFFTLGGLEEKLFLIPLSEN